MATGHYYPMVPGRYYLPDTVEPGVDVYVFHDFFAYYLMEKSRGHWAYRPRLQRAKFLKERGRGWKGIWNGGR